MEDNFKKPKIDVMKSSPLENAIELVANDLYFSDKDTRHSYTEKDLESRESYRQNIAVERFVSLLSKGILHVSDIIEKEGKYYSRHNYSLQENSKPAKEGEIEAEMFLLRYLFGDWDKGVTDTMMQDNIYTKDDKFAHFDYSEAFRNSTRPNSFVFKANEDPEIFKDKINNLLNNPILIDSQGDHYTRDLELNDYHEEDYYRKFASSEAIRKVIFEKTVSFLTMIKVETTEKTSTARTNDYFMAVISKAKLDLNNERFSFLQTKTQEERVEELRNILIKRLEFLKSLL